MYKTVTKLSDKQKDELITHFLEKIGSRLKNEREKHSIAQTDLAYCLDFSAAVSITVDRKERQKERRRKRDAKQATIKMAGQEKVLKGQIYDVNEEEVYEPVEPETEKMIMKSPRELYKDAEIHTELTPPTRKWNFATL